jgi:hypothetical protein
MAATVVGLKPDRGLILNITDAIAAAASTTACVRARGVGCTHAHVFMSVFMSVL